MLTSIEIENFKGIAGRQRIDFAPLTLLFGANSAGKSTILQALLYLYEVIERGSADVDRTELGGNVLELGGFARLVHRHETDRPIVLRAEFATPGGMERFGRDLSDFPFPDLDDDVETAWVEITIRYRRTPTFEGPLIDSVVIGVNQVEEPFVHFENGTSLRDGEPLYAAINFAHPVLARLRTESPDIWSAVEVGSAFPDGTSEALEEERRALESTLEELTSIGLPHDLLERALGEQGTNVDTGALRWRPFFAVARSRKGALPSLVEALRVLPFGDLDGDREELLRLTRLTQSDEVKQRKESLDLSIETCERAVRHVRTVLEVALGAAAQLSSFLHDAIYIGPLRTIPPRGFLYERAGRITAWGDGLAAWDSLLSDRLNLIEDTNKELRRLGAGCQIAAQQLNDTTADAEQVSANHPDKTVRRLLLDTGSGTFVLPSEVGAGISQIIPVVVAALDRRSGLTLIEQPELHVHPAVQVGLGDLFIDSIMREGSRRTMLIETHSEHLILRLLRRIRETTENNLPEEALPFTEDKLSVLYVESTPDGVHVRRLRVDEHGEFIDRWPKGFFEERAEELF
jgi:hypothetical protein